MNSYETLPLPASLEEQMAYLRHIAGNSADLLLDPVTVGCLPCALAACEGMVSSAVPGQNLIEPLMQLPPMRSSDALVSHIRENMLLSLDRPVVRDLGTLFRLLHSGFAVLLIVYIFTSSVRAQCSQFVRARELVRLFSFDGILTTLLLLVFNIIFISHMGMGVRGFMLSTILSDLSSSVFLFFAAGLRRYLKAGAFSLELGKVMLRFCIPLIPTTVMWTFTGFSDQLFIGGIKGDDDAGIYSAATKIPNLVSMLSTIFFQSWNMSAITENDSSDRNIFYEKVYGAYEAVLFIGGAGLILLVKPLSAVLINYSVYPEYKAAYLYTPLLIAAAVFTCLDLFLASIYTATDHTKNAFITILVVCLSNIVLNSVMIPLFGIQGAALATFISYFLCYIIRIIDARRFVPFKCRIAVNIIGTALILVMSLLVVLKPKGYILTELLLTGVVTIVFIRPLMPLIQRVSSRLRRTPPTDTK